MYKVLFVCLGNICRSPLAAALFEYRVLNSNVGITFEVGSAGTINYHAGKPADERVLQLLKEKNIPIQHSARRIQVEDFDYYDFIFAMDEENYDSLKKFAPLKNHKAKLIHFRKYDPYNQGSFTVPDPYYGDMNDFNLVFSICDDVIDNLIDKFKLGEPIN
ncbi:MAG: low molecular weight phosphotyrosine protein phosphatase [Bacteroidia bacterium]|nr:low molecular weight phosphotyrosine protein phosphatase [Bacteroidia bacterium]